MLCFMEKKKNTPQNLSQELADKVDFFTGISGKRENISSET